MGCANRVAWGSVLGAKDRRGVPAVLGAKGAAGADRPALEAAEGAVPPADQGALHQQEGVQDAVPHAVGTVIRHVQAVEVAVETARALVLGVEDAEEIVNPAQGVNRTAARAAEGVAGANLAVDAWELVADANPAQGVWESATEAVLPVLVVVRAKGALVAEDAAGAVLRVDRHAKPGAKGANRGADQGAKAAKGAVETARGSAKILVYRPAKGAKEPAKRRALDKRPIQLHIIDDKTG